MAYLDYIFIRLFWRWDTEESDFLEKYRNEASRVKTGPRRRVTTYSPAQRLCITFNTFTKSCCVCTRFSKRMSSYAFPVLCSNSTCRWDLIHNHPVLFIWSTHFALKNLFSFLKIVILRAYDEKWMGLEEWHVSHLIPLRYFSSVCQQNSYDEANSDGGIYDRDNEAWENAWASIFSFKTNNIMRRDEMEKDTRRKCLHISRQDTLPKRKPYISL